MARSKTSNIFVWIILGLLFVGLIGFGATGLSGTTRTLGKVGDKDIPMQTYANELNQQIRAFEAQIGTTVSFPQAQAIGLDQSVLSQVIARRTLDNEASRLGLSVGDAAVAERVREIPAFQGVDGNFNREAYTFALERSGLSVAEFEESIREEAARTLLQGAVVSGITAPETYADALVTYISQTRDFAWAEVTALEADITLPEPSDADLQAYYDANPDAFTSPETRVITYAWLTPDMIQDEVTVDEEELQQAYQDRINDFVQPERRLVERLVYGTEEQAAEALARVTAGEASFEDLVEERGLALSDTDLGDVAQDELGLAGEPVFAASTGDVVGPVMTSLGPALFRMNAVLAAREVTFEEARDELREERAAARARRVIDDSREGISDLLVGGARLEDVVERTDMQLGQIDWTPETSEGIAAYEAFRTAASEAEVGGFPAVDELEDGGLFALRVDEVRAPELRPLADVRDDVIAGWETQERQTLTLAFAEGRAQAIRDGDVTISDAPLFPAIETGQTRRSFIAGTPPGFMAEVFEMEVGDVRVVPSENGAVIVVLNAIADPDPADTAVQAERDSVRETAGAGIAQDIFEVFNAQVQTRTEVTINEAAVNAVHSSFQ